MPYIYTIIPTIDIYTSILLPIKYMHEYVIIIRYNILSKNIEESKIISHCTLLSSSNVITRRPHDFLVSTMTVSVSLSCCSPDIFDWTAVLLPFQLTRFEL